MGKNSFLHQVIHTVFAILLLAFCLLLMPVSGKADSSEVRYEVDQNYPPFTYTSNQKIYGFDPDFTSLIFQKNDYQLKLSSGVWADVYQKLVEGKIDIGGIIAVTDERKKQVLFSEPLFSSSVSVYTLAGFQKIKYAELNQLKIGVGKGYYTEELLKNNLQITDYTAYTDMEKAITDLKAGKLDAIFEDHWLMDSLLVEHMEKGVIIAQINGLFPKPHAYAISKKRPELVSYINKRVEILKKNGMFDELYAKYFYSHSEYYFQTQYKQIIIMVFLIVTIILVTFILLKFYIERLKKRLLQNYEELDQANQELERSNSLLQDQYEEIQAQFEEIQTQYEEIERNREDIRRGGERYQLVFEASNNGLWDWDMETDTFFLSDQWAEKLGFPSVYTNSFRNSWKGMLASREPGELDRQLLHFLRGEKSTFQTEIEIKDVHGKYFWVMIKAKAIRNLEGIPVRLAGSISDINQRKTYENKIYQLAYTDYLTHIPNRVRFREFFRKLLSDKRDSQGFTAFFYMDMDNFKHINDTFGHEYGDVLLKSISQCLSQAMCKNQYVFRIGGDEFGIIIDHINSRDEIVFWGEQLISLLTKEWKVKDKEVFVSVSMGVTVIPDDGTDYQEILKNADAALYAAKEDGKSCFRFFHVNMLEKVKKRLDMEHRLRKAIEKQEFRLFYQPYFRTGDGSLAGMEALIRWQNPSIGFIPPAEFIPIAEDSGLIREIGQWVLNEACHQNQKWQEMGLPAIPVAVNVSELQLEDPDFSRKLKQTLRDSRLSPEFLHIEITESCIIKSMENAAELQKEIRSLGVEISMDDFGTGYSSLNYLQHLPISTVKIDKSFIDEIPLREDGQLILSEIISIAHKLQMKVIAEGVEVELQSSYLCQENCDFIQGFYMSRPLPSHEMEALLRQCRYQVN